MGLASGAQALLQRGERLRKIERFENQPPEQIHQKYRSNPQNASTYKTEIDLGDEFFAIKRWNRSEREQCRHLSNDIFRNNKKEFRAWRKLKSWSRVI